MSDSEDELNIDLKKRSPADVLEEKMLFNDTLAQEIIIKIIRILKEDPRPRGDLLAMMYKKLTEANDLAIECAAKLAPYRHGKIENISIKKKVEHRFVLRAPLQANTTEDWLKTVPAAHAVQLAGVIKDQIKDGILGSIREEIQEDMLDDNDKIIEQFSIEDFPDVENNKTKFISELRKEQQNGAGS